MDAPSPAPPPVSPITAPSTDIRILGAGNAGLAVLDLLVAEQLPATAFLAINSDAQSLARSRCPEKLQVALPRADRQSPLPDDAMAQLKTAVTGARAVFIVLGLGGATGTELAPVLARAAKEAGALVIGFVTLPFTFECNRLDSAAEGLRELKAAADGVICLPNQKLEKLLAENISFLDTFKRSAELLADAVRGIWRLLAHKALIEIHFDDLAALIRNRHAESAFAIAEAAGATRSRDVVEKLLAHPLLDGGQALADADAVLVSLLGGPDLTLVEVNRVMEQITAKCPQAQVTMGAAIQEGFREQLAVTLIAASHGGPEPQANDPRQAQTDTLDSQLLSRAEPPRPESRFVPPPPQLSPDRVAQMLSRQGTGAASRGRKSGPKMRQTQLPLEIVSKGRFDKSEPTIHKGEDLDVPTYIRRGISLN